LTISMTSSVLTGPGLSKTLINVFLLPNAHRIGYPTSLQKRSVF
jgi:hypothetical protein